LTIGKRAILVSKNDSVTNINTKIISMFQAHQQTYLSFDSLSDQDEAVDID